MLAKYSTRVVLLGIVHVKSWKQHSPHASFMHSGAIPCSYVVIGGYFHVRSHGKVSSVIDGLDGFPQVVIFNFVERVGSQYSRAEIQRKYGKSNLFRQSLYVVMCQIFFWLGAATPTLYHRHPL